jgi:hypothetical protein
MKRIAAPILFAGLIALCGCGQKDAITPDLAFNFTCHGKSYPPSEDAMEAFLTVHGFTAFNEERVRKQYHLRLYPLAVDGYDAHHRMLDFRGINEKPADEANDAPVPTATFYDKVYAAEQTRIAAGRRCDRESGKPLDTHCPN